jgi:hypothetical protein
MDILMLSEQGRTLRPRDINQFERKLGTSLPEQYRRFLAAHNGGIPDPSGIAIDKLPGSPTDVQEFFGIDREGDTTNLAWYITEASDRFPRGTLPVACDSGGNLFCLVLDGRQKGSVVYADLSEGMVYPVAETFDAFLKMICIS